MAGAALHGSTISPVTKPNHVTYDIEEYKQIRSGYCAVEDPEDPEKCLEWVPAKYDWVNTGSGSTGAKITGSVSCPASKLKIQGNNVAKVGDITIETWVADPPVPSDTSSKRYVNVKPFPPGNGQGTITGSNNKAYLSSSNIAMVGSQITTHLGVTTTIADGNTKLNF